MEIQTDFLVLGSGIAGLSFAIKAAELGTVAIVTKKETFESSTNYAQGGIAAVQDEEDSFASHIQDTLACGADLCQEDVVRFVVEEGPARIEELVHWGVQFTRREDSGGCRYDLGREGGHSRRRVLHAKDLTGREIERALTEHVSRKKSVHIYENFIAIDLIMESFLTGRKDPAHNRCLGAYVLDFHNNRIHTFKSKYIILATGGCGKVYLVRPTPISPRVTASPWPTGPAPGSPTWNSSSFTQPACITRMPNPF
ncbi:MAG TPA: FAD-binding protein [Prolixibacteraceae bacterium]|nr:FAD-binding protein [Prolixibacteraceae bacterium]